AEDSGEHGPSRGSQLTRVAGTARCLEARGGQVDGIIAEPEITTRTLTAADEFVVIACDGLWDALTHEQVIAVIQDTVKQPAMSAQRLVTEAITSGSTDNVTAIVAFLKPGGSHELVSVRSHAGEIVRKPLEDDD
ncbi:hypothetical protein CYMTET_34500, partial [Cymbomonas tetramitiformis]